MRILAIDPGAEKSAVVMLSGQNILHSAIEKNEKLARQLASGMYRADVLAVEMIASYGMPVGAEVFNTCFWIGRFVQAWSDKYELIYRKDVKLCLCGSVKAKDANIRQAIIDLYPKTGGGRVPQIGTKKQKGMLYGIRADMWSAIAVAITAQNKIKY